jgi:hypothetical protein
LRLGVLFFALPRVGMSGGFATRFLVMGTFLVEVESLEQKQANEESAPARLCA